MASSDEPRLSNTPIYTDSASGGVPIHGSETYRGFSISVFAESSGVLWTGGRYRFAAYPHTSGDGVFSDWFEFGGADNTFAAARQAIDNLPRERMKTMASIFGVPAPIIGADGNAFSILGICSGAARRAGIAKEDIDAFMAEATAGDYDHLLRTCMKYFDVGSVSDDYDDFGKFGSKEAQSVKIPVANMIKSDAVNDLWDVEVGYQGDPLSYVLTNTGLTREQATALVDSINNDAADEMNSHYANKNAQATAILTEEEFIKSNYHGFPKYDAKVNSEVSVVIYDYTSDGGRFDWEINDGGYDGGHDGADTLDKAITAINRELKRNGTNKNAQFDDPMALEGWVNTYDTMDQGVAIDAELPVEMIDLPTGRYVAYTTMGRAIKCQSVRYDAASDKISIKQLGGGAILIDPDVLALVIKDNLVVWRTAASKTAGLDRQSQSSNRGYPKYTTGAVIITGGFRDGALMDIVPYGSGIVLQMEYFSSFDDFPYYFGSKSDKPKVYKSVDAAIKAVQGYLDKYNNGGVASKLEGKSAKTASVSVGDKVDLSALRGDRGNSIGTVTNVYKAYDGITNVEIADDEYANSMFVTTETIASGYKIGAKTAQEVTYCPYCKSDDIEEVQAYDAPAYYCNNCGNYTYTKTSARPIGNWVQRAPGVDSWDWIAPSGDKYTVENKPNGKANIILQRATGDSVSTIISVGIDPAYARSHAEWLGNNDRTASRNSRR